MKVGSMNYIHKFLETFLNCLRDLHLIHLYSLYNKNSTSIYKVALGISFVRLIYSKLAYCSIIKNSLYYMPLQ